MASGDIGTVIESRLYSLPSEAYPFESYRSIDPNQFQHISGDVYAFFSRQTPFAMTFSCTAAGDLSNAYLAQLDLTAQTVKNYSTAYFHISENIYGCVYSTSVSGSRYMRVVTFSISDDGLTIAIIADTVISAEGHVNTCIYGLNVDFLGSNQYVFTGQASSAAGGATATLRFKFFTVSDDGTAIAEVATSDYSSLEATSWGGCFKKITNEYYLFAYVYVSGNYVARSFRVQAGGIVTFIDNLTLGYMGQPTATLNVNICKISPYVWSAAMNEYTGAAKKRLITFECDETGNLGSILDTDDSVIIGNGVRMMQLEYYPGLKFVLITHVDGSGGRIHTISIELDGTIGARIGDKAPSSYPYYTYYTGKADTYVCFTTESPIYARSLTVVLPDPEIETLGYSDVKHDRSTLWGNVTEAGMADQYGFDWSLDSGSFENELLSADPLIPGVFSIELTGLAYFTSYKFRAKIGIGGVWTYGATRGFMTSYPVPQVGTEPPALTGDHYIDAVGRLISSGGIAAIDRYGFVYGCTQIDDKDAGIGHDDEPKNCGYDQVESVIGTLGAPLLASNAAAGQNVVAVVSAAGLVAGQQVIVADNDNEETATIGTVVGTNVTMTTNLAYTYYTSKAAQIQSRPTIRLRNLEYGKRYHYRFWAHNSFGYAYGSEICSLTSDTVNLLYPVSTASKGIRFCIPGKVNFLPTGMYYDTRHHLLVRSPDCIYVNQGAFGYVTGKYVCERQYYAQVTNRDLYNMSNPTRRTGTIVKVKYKARVGNNGYALGSYHKRVISDGSTELTGDYMSGTSLLPWHCKVFYDNPWTSAPWTVGNCDGLQLGISIRSGTGFETPLCDCIEGRVIWANAAVTTKSPKFCTPISVQFNGLVTEDECEDCIVHFEYGPTALYGSVTAGQAAVKGQAFSAEIAYTAPAPGTYYHYRAVIETACDETFYGADMLYPNGLVLELAFEQSILTVAPIWTDVSTYCLKLHTKRGRLHELDRCEAGVATFILNNATGYWWRYNTAGAFYGTAGGVKPLTLVRLRYSYNGINSIYYGVAESFKPKWLAESGGYTPVMELNCVDVFKSFTRYKIIDANPALIEDAIAGHGFVYVDSTRGLVEGQSIRIYEGDKTQTTTILQVVASLNLVIFDDVLAENYGTDARLKKFPSVLSGRRMKDILLECKWPLALTAIDDGTVTLVELSPKTGGDNAMEAAFKTMEAEDGNLFVSAAGLVTFHDAAARTKAPYNESQATFSDDGTHSKYFLPELSDDDEFIYNECGISGEAIGDQTMLDEDLQLEQGPRSIDKTDSPLADAADAFDQATVKVEKYKLPLPRCTALIVRPDADSDDLWPKVLGYDLGTKITLELNSEMNPACINVPYHIEGVTHNWEASTGLWETKWQLWDVNKYYMFRGIRDGWLKNVWPEPYTYADIHDDQTAAFLYQDEEAEMQIGQVPAIAFAFNEEIRRGLLKFDTGKLADLGDISSAKIILMLRPQLSIYNRIAFDLCLVGDGGAVFNLSPSDYGKLLNQGPGEGSLSIYGSITIPANFREPDPFHPVGIYMLAVIELNAAGIEHINKFGTSFFGLRSKRDIDAVEPSGGNAEFVYIEGHNGDFAPRLMVQVG